MSDQPSRDGVPAAIEHVASSPAPRRTPRWLAPRARDARRPVRVECDCPLAVRGACGCGPRVLPRAPIAIGTTLGTLTITAGDVYHRSTTPSRHFERWVEAACTCGAATTMRAHAWLAAERWEWALTCGGAAHAAERAARHKRGAAHPLARYVGPVPSSVWARIRANARRQAKKHARRGEPFACTLTHADLAALWARQGGHCAYTGIPLTLSPRARATTASLDRIDSRQGYVLDNVQFVHKTVNAIKLDFPEHTFLHLAGAVARHATRRGARTMVFGMVPGRTSEEPPQAEFPGWGALMATSGPLPGVAAAVDVALRDLVSIPWWCLGRTTQDRAAATALEMSVATDVPEWVATAPAERAKNGRTYRRALYRCHRCRAQRLFVARVDNVRYGNTRSCGCFAARGRATALRPVAGVIGRTYWTEVQRNADVREIAFALAPAAAWAQYLAQGGRCALTGWRIDFAGTREGQRRQTASLDRVDAGGEYAPNNVVWTHKAVNGSRFDLSIVTFVGWCIAITTHRARRAVVHAPLDDLPLFASATTAA